MLIKIKALNYIDTNFAIKVIMINRIILRNLGFQSNDNDNAQRFFVIKMRGIIRLFFPITKT